VNAEVANVIKTVPNAKTMPVNAIIPVEAAERHAITTSRFNGETSQGRKCTLIFGMA
jgi:hypothetical protein